MAAPTALIGQGINQMLIADVSLAILEQRPTVWRTLRTPTMCLLAISLACASTLGLLAPLMTPVVFGPEWAAAGEYIRLLAPPMCLQLVAIPMVSVLAMLGRQRTILVAQMFRILGILACAAIGHALSLDLKATLIAIAVVWTLSYLATIVAAAHASRTFDARNSPRS